MVNQDRILHIAHASARSNFPFFLSGDVSFRAARDLGTNSLFLYFTDEPFHFIFKLFSTLSI